MDTRRQMDIVPRSIRRLSVDVVGLGMHGSWTALAVARLGVKALRLWDDDVVAAVNVATQAYLPEQIGRPKAECLAEMVSALGIEAIEQRQKFPSSGWPHPWDVVICCADNHDTRRLVAAAASQGSKLFIESRSGGEVIYIHAFPPTADNLSEYLSTCFPTNNYDAPCGARGTAYVGMAVASTVAAIIVNWQKGGGTCLQTHKIIPAFTSIVTS